MKQHITKEQLNELSETNKLKLIELFKDCNCKSHSEWTGKYKMSINDGPPYEILTRKEMIDKDLEHIVKSLDESDGYCSTASELIGWKTLQRHKIFYPLPTIGHMIEFLEKNKYMSPVDDEWKESSIAFKWENKIIWEKNEELVDVLWQSVKKVVNQLRI